jgi:hypothetical protein
MSLEGNLFNLKQVFNKVDKYQAVGYLVLDAREAHQNLVMSCGDTTKPQGLYWLCPELGKARKGAGPTANVPVPSRTTQNLRARLRKMESGAQKREKQRPWKKKPKTKT